MQGFLLRYYIFCVDWGEECHAGGITGVAGMYDALQICCAVSATVGACTIVAIGAGDTFTVTFPAIAIVAAFGTENRTNSPARLTAVSATTA